MKIKNNAKIETSDFYYDLFDGGYIKPEEVLESEEDIKRVQEALGVINTFKESVEEIIEYM